MLRQFSALIAAIAILVASCASGGSDDLESSLDSIASRALPTSNGERSVGSVALPDVSNDGTPFALTAQPGEVLVVYFGFTSCPDVCPTTLADLKSALETLGSDASSVDVAMITVDPDRDSAEALVEYVQWFVPGAHALRTGDQAMLAAAGEAFGASFSVVSSPDGEVEVLHTAYLYAVDETGTVVATWPFGIEPEAIAAGIASELSE